MSSQINIKIDPKLKKQVEEIAKALELGYVINEPKTGQKWGGLVSDLIKGETDIDQLSKIFGIRGTPNDTNWPEVKALPFYFKFEDRDPIDFRRIIPNVPESALDLIEGMLQLNPRNRMKWDEIVNHEFFKQVKGAEECDYVKHIIKFKNAEVQ